MAYRISRPSGFRSLSDVLREARQYESITGRPMTSAEIEALARPYFEEERQRLSESEQMQLLKKEREETTQARRRWLDIQEEAATKESAAATVGGIAQLGQLGFKGYDIYKGFKTPAPVADVTKSAVAYPPGLEPQVITGAPMGAPQAVTPITGGIAPATTPAAMPLLKAAGVGAVSGAVAGTGAQLITKAGEEGHEGGERITSAVIGAKIGATIAGIITGGNPLAMAAGAATGGTTGWNPDWSDWFKFLDCIIVTACTDRNSEEVQIAREYRDKALNEEAKRGYYIIAESIVPMMEKDEEFKNHVKTELVDPLIRYGKFALQKTTKSPSAKDIKITVDFINTCDILGKLFPLFIRNNGEVV